MVGQHHGDHYNNNKRRSDQWWRFRDGRVIRESRHRRQTGHVNSIYQQMHQWIQHLITMSDGKFSARETNLLVVRHFGPKVSAYRLPCVGQAIAPNVGECTKWVVRLNYYIIALLDVVGVPCTPLPAPVLVLAPCASLRPRLASLRPNPAPVRRLTSHQRDADATCTPSNTTRHSRDSENSFVEQ